MDTPRRRRGDRVVDFFWKLGLFTLASLPFLVMVLGAMQ